MSDAVITIVTNGSESCAGTGEKQGNERQLPAPVGAGFLQLLKMNGYPLVCCSGKGSCGRCRIRFMDGEAPLPTPADRIALRADELREGVRLACMHRVKRSCRIRVEFIHPRPVSVVTRYAADFTGDTADGTACSPADGTADSVSAPDGVVEGAPYVLAIDLGTTTIAMQAVSIRSLRAEKPGSPVRSLADFGTMNPQRAWGSDVISRIRAAGEGQETAMTEAVRTALREGMEKIRNRVGWDPETVCLAGNTVMEHLLMGLDSAGLGAWPFTPVCLSRQQWENVCVLPGISAFVGADILAGLLACGFDREEGIRLFIDLGTNGEMAIGDGKRLICTAAAAGPAFEGGAAANVPGTDMVAVLADMLEDGSMDETGLLREELFEEGWQRGELRVSQQDIRALQMAKAAVRAGVELLMERMGTAADQISRVFLAGGFGYYLDVHKAARIGLFPGRLEEKVTAVGNTSLLGAALYGADPAAAERAERLRERAEVMNLAHEPGFEALYVENMNFCPPDSDTRKG